MVSEVISSFIAIFPTYFISHRVLKGGQFKLQLIRCLDEFGIDIDSYRKFVNKENKDALEEHYDSYIANDFHNNNNLDLEFEFLLGTTARLVGRYKSAILHFERVIEFSNVVENSHLVAKSMAALAYTLD